VPLILPGVARGDFVLCQGESGSGASLGASIASLTGYLRMSRDGESVQGRVKDSVVFFWAGWPGGMRWILLCAEQMIPSCAEAASEF
jgi:hypothetical protein